MAICKAPARSLNNPFSRSNTGYLEFTIDAAFKLYCSITIRSDCPRLSTVFPLKYSLDESDENSTP